VKFGKNWVNLDKLDKIWVNLVKFDHVWTKIKIYQKTFDVQTTMDLIQLHSKTQHTFSVLNFLLFCGENNFTKRVENLEFNMPGDKSKSNLCIISLCVRVM